MSNNVRIISHHQHSPKQHIHTLHMICRLTENYDTSNGMDTTNLAQHIINLAASNTAILRGIAI